MNLDNKIRWWIGSKHTVFYAATAAWSAFLLFLVEPMFAKMILPRLGGAANVWITAMLFYQFMLFLGYGYAHLLGHLAPFRQWQVHIALVLLSTLVLPLAVPTDWSPPQQGNPSLALLGMMTLELGAPFAILSATAPLVQRWLFISRPMEDPYLLYAFSNAGSFAALFSYPLILEPNLSLAVQSRFWAVGFVLFGAALLFAGPLLRGAAYDPVSTQDALPWRFAWRWLALAALPSSLMLSTSSFLTTDVASIPLLWVIPLALYLTTFILAFSGASERVGSWAARYYPVVLVPLCMALAPVLGKSKANPAFLLPLPLSAFFLAALLCHCELARIKPKASQLTLYFLVVSCGGALGGAFNSLLAPVIFADVYEFPIGLALACLALPASGPRYSVLALVVAGSAGVASALAERFPLFADGSLTTHLQIIYKALMVVGVLALWQIRRFPMALALGVAAFLLVPIFGLSSDGVFYTERNFYGVNRVSDDIKTGVRTLEHGTTVHGLMALAPEHRLTLLGYHNPAGPLGEATRLYTTRPNARIAMVGLGAGEMLCNVPAGAHFDFYELDPAVARIANDRSLFPFLAECPAGHTLILGDGRLQMQRAPDAAYDVIIVDAFTSDAIPHHLMTREALAEYMRKLKSDGLLLLHISSRYFNLSPAIAAEARELELAGAIKLHAGGVVEKTTLPISGTLVVALARTPAVLSSLYSNGWKRMKPIAGGAACTDDWCDLLSALIFPWRPVTLAWDDNEDMQRGD
jgi:spermidine synthase